MSPLETVQSFYAALGRRDVHAVLALFAETIEWREAEGFPYFGGTWTRPQQVVEGLLGPLDRDWDEFSARADGFVSEGDEVVAFGTYRGVNRATRLPLFAPFAHRWRVACGRIVAFTQYTDTVLVQAAAGV
jgi:ketosteroid isomerase-like protein